jgi:hypothetical protein
VTGSRLSFDAVERELGEWLVEESQTRAPVGLVEDVFARTARTGQASRWWPPAPATWVDLVLGRSARGDAAPSVVGRRSGLGVRPLSAFAGTVAVVLIAVVLVIGSGWRGVGPGTSANPIPSGVTSPSPTTSPSSSPSPSVSPLGPPTPEPTTIGSLAASRLNLGPDAGPIQAIEAFGSIWVANIHANDVRRYEPTTMAEIARIPVDSAAWFAATDDAVWVTSQTGAGLSRIDPATNRIVAHVGDVPPCAAPVLAFDSLWQAACDGNAILRIDPRSNEILDTFPLNGRLFLVFAGGRLITVGPEGLEAMDPATGTFTAVGGGRRPSETALIVSDGPTVWEINIAGVARLDPETGKAIAAFPYPTAHGVAFSGDHAWLTVDGVGAIEIDLATNAERRTIAVPGSALLPLEARGSLWLTSFDASDLWRIDL